MASNASALGKDATPRTAPVPPATPARAGASHAWLRAATADLHAQVDGLFPDGIDSAQTYRRYLLGMHRFTADCEVATGHGPRASSWLAADLAALGVPPMPTRRPRRALLDDARRLGWEYVLAGSSLGARVLLPAVARLGLDDMRGAAFLAHHAAGEDWSRLQPRLAALDEGDARRRASVASGARDAFAHVRACFARSFDALSTDTP